MPRSVGEAAALGLESGFVLGRNTQQMMREEARRDQLLQQRTEDRQMERATAAETRARQMNLDRIAALDAQTKGLGAEQQGIIDSGVQQTPEQQAQFTQKVSGIQKARQELLARISGYDLTAAQKTGKAAITKLQGGSDPSTLAPGELSAAVAVATNGRNPTDFVRQNGQPSVIEQAGQSFVQGIQSGDEAAVLKGANVIFAPSLRNGVGSKSPHGGTVVGKEFVGLEPAPGGDPKDPRFIPTVRVYVKDDESADSDKPFGASSYYDAPLTEDRSSSPDAKVKTIGMREGMDILAHNLSVAEQLNTPQAAAKLQEDQQSGAFDPELYAAALGAAGVKSAGPKKKVVQHTIPAGGSLATSVTDEKTGLISTTITQGNPKPPSGSSGALQQSITAIKGLVEAGDLSEEEGKSLISARVKKDVTGTKAQGLSVGGGGKGGGKGGEDGAGITAAEKRALDVQRDSLKRKTKSVDDQRKRVRDTYEDDLPEKLSPMDMLDDAAKAARQEKIAAARKKRDAALKRLDAEQAKIDEQESALDARMTNTEGPTAANPKPKPTGGAGKSLADTPSKAPAGAKDFSNLWK